MRIFERRAKINKKLIPFFYSSITLQFTIIDILNESVSRKELNFTELLNRLAKLAFETSSILIQYGNLFSLNDTKFSKNIERIKKTRDNLNDILLKNEDTKNSDAHLQVYNLITIVEILINIINTSFKDIADTTPEKNLMIRYLEKFIECANYFNQAIFMKSHAKENVRSRNSIQFG